MHTEDWPWHERPSLEIMYPLWHWHVKFPSVLTQRPFWQRPTSVRHSLMSTKQIKLKQYYLKYKHTHTHWFPRSLHWIISSSGQHKIWALVWQCDLTRPRPKTKSDLVTGQVPPSPPFVDSGLTFTVLIGGQPEAWVAVTPVMSISVLTCSIVTQARLGTTLINIYSKQCLNSKTQHYLIICIYIFFCGFFFLCIL